MIHRSSDHSNHQHIFWACRMIIMKYPIKISLYVGVNPYGVFHFWLICSAPWEYSSNWLVVLRGSTVVQDGNKMKSIHMFGSSPAELGYALFIFCFICWLLFIRIAGTLSCGWVEESRVRVPRERRSAQTRGCSSALHSRLDRGNTFIEYLRFWSFSCSMSRAVSLGLNRCVNSLLCFIVCLPLQSERLRVL